MAASARFRDAGREGLSRSRRTVLGRASAAPAATSTSSSRRAVRSPPRCATATPPTRRPSSPSILPRRELVEYSRRARRRRRRGPVPDPAQRRRGELHARRGAGRAIPTALPHADRAPRRRPARRRRRVRRPSGGQLPPRGVAANPVVAHLCRRRLRRSRRRSLRHRADVGRACPATPTGLAEAAGRADVVRRPGADLRHRPGHRRAHAAARADRARRLPARRLRGAPDWARRTGRHPGAGIDRAPRGPAVPGARTALRLRRLRDPAGSAVLDRAAVAAGPGHGVRHRPRAWRRRDGQAVVRARQAIGEEEHLHRLRRGGNSIWWTRT